MKDTPRGSTSEPPRTTGDVRILEDDETAVQVATQPPPATAKNWIIGKPLPNASAQAQLLPKRLALPIFASDPLSSVAYAPQELVLILLIGGTSFLSFAPYIAAAVILLLAIVVASYRQIIKVYPGGGGAYEVARSNLGKNAGLVVASALLVDYVLTVAVSVASGVDNIISAIPELDPARVEIAVAVVVVLVAVNLRGVREASRAFAVPTYLFVASVLIMVVVTLVRTALGDAPVAESAGYAVNSPDLSSVALVLLLLRAFASGCSALTGIEAISNGVPAFREPKVHNAQATLTVMGMLAIVLFGGLVAVALITGVHYAQDPCDLVGFAECATAPQRSLIAQVAAAVFGDASILFYVVQAVTALVLLLAANTAFNGFPVLGSILARDRYAPKSLGVRGDRLVYSNGMIALGAVAAVLLVIYQADVTTLIQLYVIGVFVSFTLGQSGMVKRWISMLRHTSTAGRGASRAQVMRGLVINGLGAACTLTVLTVVSVTKFTHGAWLVFIMMPTLFIIMRRINRYYAIVDIEVRPQDAPHFGAQHDHAIVLVGQLQRPVLKAVDYALAAHHESVEAVHVSVSAEETETLKRDWAKYAPALKLVIIPSPYRDVSWPVCNYIAARRQRYGSEVVTVYTPQYVVGRWWERVLHNHRAIRIRQRLMLMHGVIVAIVPWRLKSSDLLIAHSDRVVLGQERMGLPTPVFPWSDPTKEDPMRIPGVPRVSEHTPGAEVSGVGPRGQ